MQIQNVEALKTWLTSRLEPICEADPAALAKYVVALVKKDKTSEELMEVCKDQLEVFLSDETNKFVEVLFEALKDDSYIPSTISTSVPEKPRPVSVIEEAPPAKLVEVSVPDDDERDFRRTRKNTDPSNKPNRNSIPVDRRKRRADEDIRTDNHKIAKEDLNTKQNDSENASLDIDNKGRPQPIPTTREGNRDWDRDRRYPRDFSRSDEDGRTRRGPVWDRIGHGRDRDNNRTGRSRGHRDRYQEGRFSREAKNRCRDYEEKGFCIRGELCPFDHGNDPVIVGQEIPPMQNMMPFSGAPHFMPGAPPLPGIPPVMVTAPDNFHRNLGQPTPQPKNDTANRDSAKADPKQPEKEAPNSGTLIPNIPPPGMQTLMGLPPTGVPPQMLPMMPPRPTVYHPPADDTYNPEQPQFDRPPVWMRVGIPGQMPPGSIPYNPDMAARSRELVTVPPDQSQITVQVTTDPPTGETSRVVIGPPGSAPDAAADQSDAVKNVPMKRKFSDTLEIKKIPRDQNNITKLNEYFKRFGNIVNIQVNAFNDPEAALVQFSNSLEARNAYRCPDAVLGSRFIRVFWHNPDQQPQQKDNSAGREPKKVFEPKKPTMFQSGKTTFVRKPSEAATTESSTVPQTVVSETKSSTTTATITTTSEVTTSAAVLTVAPATTPASAIAPSASTTVTSTVKPVVNSKLQQQQDLMIKKLEIQKQKQELLDKQIQQQKLLISKLEKKNLSANEKSAIMKTLKLLSSNIEGLKQEVEIAAITVKSKESPQQARQIAQKAILDQELDLISHQHHGEDTTELKKKVEELKQEAKSLGLFDGPSRGRGASAHVRGRGRGARGRGRGAGARVWTRESATLDKRPKQISVANITSEQKENVVEHFMEFGNVDRVDYESKTSILVLTFRTRKEAEIAFAKGRRLKEQMLDVSWYRPSSPTAASAASPATPTPGVRNRSSTISSGGLDEDLALDLGTELEKHDVDHEAEEALLLEDFDEEEDEEERSWRR
ncbi:RNA-binding protein 26 [Nematostella vectensis]|uniref:RNA-binding protein 26 n=1 Tax=Nematostella vectensis TaxID=45351 RepID=UPI002077287F|nr:RNA-binding protein 26 [Nematostella vectensis]